jgi:ABC-2 type transport system permease protein
MSGFRSYLALSLRLHFRNRMALLYGFLFPLIFLVAFWVLYRHERVPLIRHLGEFLTVSILGGACFGLPTTLVGERERGVWRRYRLTPVSPAVLLGGTLLARYALILLAGLLQLALAFALGMPAPAQPADLFLAFTAAAFAFIGLGLVIATLADNVPAVQALGQCIFLPMLIIGGVAVPLTALPDWAQHVSAFFPGRYAVEALQSTATGDGLASESFAVLALAVIGASSCLAGARLFRWDPQQTFRSLPGKGWTALVLTAWLAVGVWAEWLDRVPPRLPPPQTSAETPPPPPPASNDLVPPKPAPEPASATPPPEPSSPARPAIEPDPAPEPQPQPEPEPEPSASAEPRSWREINPGHLNAIRHFQVPPDHGVVTPWADPRETPDDFVADELDGVRELLPHWGPGLVSDPVQRVRNLLYVAAVPDAVQQPIERYLPQLVYEQLQTSLPREDLVRVLGWIVLTPLDGDTSAIARVHELGLEDAVQVDVVRERAYYYAIKMIQRLPAN